MIALRGYSPPMPIPMTNLQKRIHPNMDMEVSVPFAKGTPGELCARPSVETMTTRSSKP
jgi:hypothetical protein